MKIAEILEIADNRTEHDGYSWSQPGVHTCFGKGGRHNFQVRGNNNPNAENDFQYYAIAPEMESKLRAMQELMPEIKNILTTASERANDDGGYWLAKTCEDLLKSLEVWENE